ncbi:MAG TPA: biopolymer transporter ExbD [Polyangiaceae bacterium]|nr:biopolymer transporter ExbD [Polyangiaceae bacterium]
MPASGFRVLSPGLPPKDRVLGGSESNMATIDSHSAPGRARRSVNHQLPLVPFIDFLICLVVFLLANLGFANFARLQGNALVPGKASATAEAEPKRLHLELKDQRFFVTWRAGATVVASDELPATAVIEGRGDRHYPELARFLEGSFRANGVHQDPSDPVLDQAVLHTQNSATYEDVIAVLDALRAPQRGVPWSKQASVFAVSFAAD